MVTINAFVGISVNGEDFSNSDYVVECARKWVRAAEDSWDDELFWAADSLFELVDEADGTNAALADWLANPENFDDENYSDIFKDLYGFRPRW